MQALPDAAGHFGEFGGRYVPETLMPALLELEEAYRVMSADPAFQNEFKYYLREYVGRPNPLYYAERLTEEFGGAKIYLKREDLNHTGRPQNQQYNWTNSAGTSDGQETNNSRDRGGTTRRRNSHSDGEVQYGMRSLHGRGGY